MVCGPVCIAVVDAMPSLMAQFKVSSTSDLWLGFNQPAENAIRQGPCSVQMSRPNATWGCTQLIIWVGHLLVSCTGRYRAGERGHRAAGNEDGVTIGVRVELRVVISKQDGIG